MATYTPGPLGPLKGKMGNLVACNWRDIYYLRVKAKRSKKKPTKTQVSNRRGFGFVSTLLAPLRQFLLIQFKGYERGSDGMLSAQSYNYTNALIKTADGFDIDYRAARFCYGDLPGAQKASVVLKDENTLLITWSTEIKDLADHSDLLIWILACPAWNHLIAHEIQGSRKDGQLEVTIPPAMNLGVLHVQIAFKSLVNEKTSKSQYAGCIDFGRPAEAATTCAEDRTTAFCQASGISGALIKRVNLR